jgi:two-component system phosphate regulon sensor histidine kinase PhoR
MPRRSSAGSEVRGLLIGERSGPRVAQAVFLVPILVDVVLQVVGDGHLPVPFVVGLAVIVVPTVAAWGIAAGRVHPRWTLLLPILDILALGVMRTAPDSALGVAIVFPAIWLGLEFGRLGVWTTTGAVFVAVVVPTLLAYGPTVEAFSRMAQLSLMAVMASAAVALTGELWKEQSAEARRAQHRLGEAMADVLEQRRLTDGIVSTVDVGLLALDADGRYDAVNPRQAEFLRIAFPEGHLGVAGQAGFVFAADGVTPLPAGEMPSLRATAGETFRDVLIWIGEKPADRLALAVSATVHHTADGEVAGAVLSYHDITELVAATRIKEEFVASVSHELRTPLTSIIGYVDIVLEDTDDLAADVRHHLVTVQRNARRLHRLVDDLLSTALHSVTTVLDLERIGVRGLVELSAIEARRSAQRAGLTMTLDLGGPELDIEGDSSRLAQVFDNLFSNAVKYTPAGGHVTGEVVREGDEAVVRVTDTGRGIAEAELGEVFTKFFRSSSVSTSAIPGVGLGLAITKTIVEAHGGEILVRSALGEGTTFEVRLPLAAPLVAPAA